MAPAEVAAAEPLSEGGPDDDLFMVGGAPRFCDGDIVMLLRLGRGAGDPPDFSIALFNFVQSISI